MSPLRFKLAWNADAALLGAVTELNRKYTHRAVVDEVFGSLPDSEFPSARPSSRLPQVSWENFCDQVRCYNEAGITFNYLLNTQQRLDAAGRYGLLNFVEKLQAAGIRKLTVGLPETARLLKQAFPELPLVMSLSWGVKTVAQVRKAEDAGVDSLYLSGPFVNRDFALLRELLAAASIPCGLYANTSCLSCCPVLHDHYRLFAGCHDDAMVRKNDAYFSGCSYVKLLNPVEWIQMPWIRPEDVSAYTEEGVAFFKLADRFATTKLLGHVCDCYLSGISPDNLFPLFESDGRKYKRLLGPYDSKAFHVASSEIPSEFLDHFRRGKCRSANPECEYCKAIARRAVSIPHGNQRMDFCLEKGMPDELIERANASAPVTSDGSRLSEEKRMLAGSVA